MTKKDNKMTQWIEIEKLPLNLPRRKRKVLIKIKRQYDMVVVSGHYIDGNYWKLDIKPSTDAIGAWAKATATHWMPVPK